MTGGVQDGIVHRAVGRWWIVTARQDTRAVLVAHSELVGTDITGLDLAHCGCSCGRFASENYTDGHDWWLDHLTNELLKDEK